MPRKDSLIKPICETLKAQGAIEDFAYDHFKQPEAVALPYAIYRRVAQPNFSADGVVYSKGGGVDFELYSSTPDEMADLMDQVEALLDAAGGDSSFNTTEFFEAALQRSYNG